MCDAVSMLITPIVSNLDKDAITNVIRGAITNVFACLKCRMCKRPSSLILRRKEISVFEKIGMTTKHYPLTPYHDIIFVNGSDSIRISSGERVISGQKSGMGTKSKFYLTPYTYYDVTNSSTHSMTS